MANIDGTANGETLVGTADPDRIRGLGGNDILRGLAGDDTLDGGAGFDLADYSTAAAGIIAALGAGQVEDGDGGLDTLISIEGAIGSAFDDDFIGADTDPASGFETFEGLAGTDIFDGRGGFDFVSYALAAAGVTASLTAGLATDDGFGDQDGFFSIEALIGSDFDDNLTGDGFANELNGGAGADVLNGLGGNDVIRGGGGADNIDGGSGDDTLRGGAGGDRIVGGSGADALFGNNGDDVLIGGFGQDTYDGGAGTDTVDFTNEFSGVFINLDQNFVLDGQGFREDLVSIEIVIASNRADTIIGTAGDDDLEGLGGNDTIQGGAGADLIDGGSGDDTLQGQAGDDELTGGIGNDILLGGAGADELNGGAGDDTASFADLNGGVTVDLVALTAEDSDDDIDTIGTDVENIIGTSFADLFMPAVGFDIDGGFGVDTLDGSDLTGTFTVNLLGETMFEGGTFLGSVVNIENVIGSRQADNLTGNFANNTLQGGEANDILNGVGGTNTLEGEAGDDQIFDGSGTDTIDGGDGDDTIRTSGGNDVIDAGDDNDSIQAVSASGVKTIDGGANADDLTFQGENFSGDVISLSDVGGAARLERSSPIFARLDLTAIESVLILGLAGNDSFDINDISGTAVTSLEVNGGSGDDTLTGQDATTRIRAFGEAGADVMTGGSGDDRLQGDAGDDTLSGGAGADTLFGLDGNDTLTGGDGDDRLSAGNGDDLLTGGAGDDVLIGAAGFDVASYQAAGGGVTVDFVNDTAEDGDGGTDTLDRVEAAIGSNFDDLFIANDTAFFNGGAGSDTADLSNFSAGADIDLLTGEVTRNGALIGMLENIETVIGTGFDDTFLGGDGDDTFLGGAGDDAIDGGAGTDTADYSGAAAAIEASLTDNTAQDGDGGTDTFNSIERLVGSDFDDTLVGSTGSDILVGGFGTDRLNGRPGDDIMIGGRQSDVYTVDSAGDQVIEEANGGGSDRILTFIDLVLPENIETVFGVAKDRGLTITGNNIGERLVGTDVIASGDTLDGRGGDDRIQGGVGDDTLLGGVGDDRIFGNSGDDVINGGAGDDKLTGNQAADTFVHEVGGGTDQVTDFDVAQDILDVSAHGFADFAAFQAALSDVDGNTVVDLTGTDSMVLVGVVSGTIGQEDVLI